MTRYLEAHGTMIRDDYLRIAELGAIMSDETRVRLLCILLETPATTSELVARLGIVQPRVSAHLSALRKSHLVSVSVSGRQHVYTIKSSAASDAIKSLLNLAGLPLPRPTRGPRRISRTALREVGRDSSLRRARTCYDHLAGVAGVELLDEIVKRGWIEESKGAKGTRRTVFNLTDRGRRSLEKLTPEITKRADSERIFAFGCLDWTERRNHLGGFLGKVVLDTLVTHRIVAKTSNQRSRALIVRKPIAEWIAKHEAPG